MIGTDKAYPDEWYDDIPYESEKTKMRTSDESRDRLEKMVDEAARKARETAPKLSTLQS